MALPPTQIYQYIGDTPEETAKSLKNAGLLKGSAVKNDQLVGDIKKAVDLYHKRNSDMPGANEDDVTADAVSKHLSILGKWIARTPEYEPSLSFRICSVPMKWCGKIRSFFY